MVMGHTNADRNIREYKITDIDISADNQNIDISAMFIYIYIIVVSCGLGSSLGFAAHPSAMFRPKQHRIRTKSKRNQLRVWGGAANLQM